MMHYGFCRKHADQTGEGGCPECAMDHQQSTIKAMTETAAENSRVHIEMHNQIIALQAEVARLNIRSKLDIDSCCNGQKVEYRTRIAELKAEVARLRQDFCSIEELNRVKAERDHALDDLKAEITNHREDSAALESMRETAKEASRVHIEMHNQITALQAEVKTLKKQFDNVATTCELTLVERDRLQAEVARMREALERLLDDESRCDADWDIARAALEKP